MPNKNATRIDTSSATSLSRRNFLQFSSAAGLAGLFGGGLTACSSESTQSSGGKRIVIGFSHPVSEAPIVAGIRKFADERAAEVGDVEMRHDSTQSGDVQAQVNAIETWITQRVDAICVFPQDESALRDVQARAQAAGIVWTTYATGMKGEDGTVGFDHQQSGQLIADHVTQWIDKREGGDEVLLLTASAIPSVAPRIEVPKQAIEQQGIAKIVAAQDALDQATGLQVSEDTLQAHPDLNIVLGLNDDGALGAAEAFAAAGKNPEECYIAGQDGSIDALKRVDQGGAYRATAALPIREIGYGIVDLNRSLANGEQASDVVVDAVLATKEDQALLDDLIAQWG